VGRAKTRSKSTKAAPKKKPTKKRKPSTKGKKTRTLIHPETGSKIILQPYDEYPEVFKYMAKLLYITGRAGTTSIAKQLNIPLSTIHGWMARDRWTFLKREVIRVANKDLIRSSRRAMSRYLNDIDRSLNKMLRTLDTRLTAVEDDDKLKDEGAILKHTLDIIRVKLQLFRSLTYGVHGQAFQPLPGQLVFDGTEDPKHGPLFTSGALDDIMKAVPPYLQEAAKFVIGMDMEDMDPEMLEAVTQKLEELDKQAKKDIKDDDNWLDPDEDEQSNEEDTE